MIIEKYILRYIEETVVNKLKKFENSLIYFLILKKKLLILFEKIVFAVQLQCISNIVTQSDWYYNSFKFIIYNVVKFPSGEY